MYSLNEDVILQAGRTWPQMVASGAPDVDESVWREVVDPDGMGLFEQRLSWQTHLPRPDPRHADWMSELRALRCALTRGTTSDPALHTVPFGLLLAPIVADVCDRLPATQGWTDAAVASLRADLGHRIAQVTTQALYADFSASRTHGSQLMATLGWADNGDARYRSWCTEQARDGLAHVLAAYPVLGRLLATATMTWRTSTLAMMRRLRHDRGELAATFGIDATAPVTGIRPGLSDPHRGGHRVAIIEIGAHQIVYKPKDLRVEHWFQDVVRRVNGHFGDHLLHQVPVLPRPDGYGYTGVARRSPCPTPQLPRFYLAAGRLCALLFLLGATDAHYENVVAAGPGVALIDAETLFHIDLTESEPWADTVLRTGMLPSWTQSGADQQARDPSALGVETTPLRGIGWVGLNTDDMALATVSRNAAPALSLPVEATAENPLRNHVFDLVEGFRQVYLDQRLRTLVGARLAQLRGVPQRVVLRNTGVYATIAEQAVSATAMRTPQGRGLRLEQLSRAALVSGERGPLWDVFHCELQEMENLDIPYFSHVLGTDEIHGVLGPIPGIVGDDPLARAERRLRRVDDADWQEELIRGTVRARFTVVDERPAPRPAPTTDASSPAPTATSVLREVDQARRAGTWLALYRLPDGRHSRLGMIGEGWYDGRAGLSAVQDWAGRLTGDPWLREQSAATIEPVAAVLAQGDRYPRLRWLRNLGLGFAGVGGLLRCVNLDVPDLPVELLTRDRILDFMGGVAGLIGPLADDALLARAAEHLAGAQLPDGGWVSTLGNGPLTGLAHGAAGMGLALLRAGTALGRQEWIDAGARAFAYEDSLLEDGNWPDLRRTGAAPMVAWCHGAPGIGLTRLRALQLLADHRDADRWHADLQVAMRTAASAPLPATDHLCCGLTGRAAVLRICGRAMGEAAWLAAADNLTQVVIEGYTRTGRFTLANDGPANPGLMTGLAGIAAHLLSCEADTDLGAFLM